MRDHSRDRLLDLLNRYEPIDDEDRRRLRRISSFVKSEKDCFKRSHIPGHITGSAWVVDKTGTCVLLTHHKKLGKWLQLGGHADEEGDVLAVALREAREESGMGELEPVSRDIFDVDVHLIPERKNEPEHFHYDIRFAMAAREEKPFVVSGESHDLAWVPLEKLSDFTQEPSLLRMAEKWATRFAPGLR